MKSQKGNVGATRIEWLDWNSGFGAECGSAKVRVSENGGPEMEREVDWIRISSHRLRLFLGDRVCEFEIAAKTQEQGFRAVDLRSERGLVPHLDLSYWRDGEKTGAETGPAGVRKDLKVKAMMPGKVVKVNVKAGQLVEKGQSLLVMEAMKMENEIKASRGGMIKEVLVAAGQAIETGAVLAVLAKEE